MRPATVVSLEWRHHPSPLKSVARTPAIALHYMDYNFCLIHQTLRVTPAMEAGIADHVWDVKDLVALLPAIQGKPRRPYKKGK